MARYRPLGRTGILVSSLALGVTTWGRQNSEADGHTQLYLALGSGINMIDTAENCAVPPADLSSRRTFSMRQRSRN